MELKTLKDIGRDMRMTSTIPGFARDELREEMKQEAIKHIKEIDAPLKKIREDPEVHQAFQIELTNNNGVAPKWFTRSYDQILWIQHFFNITQEDLR